MAKDIDVRAAIQSGDAEALRRLLTEDKSRVNALIRQAFDGRQKEKLFLYVRSQIEQLHDLRHTATRYRPQTGQLRVPRQTCSGV